MSDDYQARREAEDRATRERLARGIGPSPLEILAREVPGIVWREVAPEILARFEWPLWVAEGSVTEKDTPIVRIIVEGTERRSPTAGVRLSVQYGPAEGSLDFWRTNGDTKTEATFASDRGPAAFAGILRRMAPDIAGLARQAAGRREEATIARETRDAVASRILKALGFGPEVSVRAEPRGPATWGSSYDLLGRWSVSDGGTVGFELRMMPEALAEILAREIRAFVDANPSEGGPS